MSVSRRLTAGEEVEIAELRDALVAVVFGNYLGVSLFAAALAWVGLYWRLGFFSNDQYTFANTLLGLVDGHLFIDRAAYGPPSGATPGTYLVDGRVYGRNYGVVVASLGWFVVLKLLAVVVDLRVLLVGLWSCAVAATAVGVGTVLGRRRIAVRVGLGIAALLFVANLVVGSPLSADWYPLLALQLTTALAAAFSAVVCYRLVDRLYDTRVAVFAGVALIVATPIGFWATLPKRHSVTALLVLCAMYTLYRSRETGSLATATRFRALTYAWVGLAAWVHAAEGLVLLVAIAAVDLPTARSNRPRDLLFVGAVLVVSLVPFFVTNALISGNPVQPPRLLPNYTGDVLSVEGSDSSASTGAGGASGSSVEGVSQGGGSAGGRLDPVSTLASTLALLVDAATLAGSSLLDLGSTSYGAMVREPGRLSTIVVRTGYVDGFRPTQDAAINLSVLASMPVLGGLVALPALVVRRVDRHVSLSTVTRVDVPPIRVLDAFSLLYALLLFGVFLSSLPVHHMFTVRYLHPLYAVGGYWLVRIPAVGRAIETNGRALAGTATATVLVGVPGYLTVIAVGALALGEAVQVYALAALAVAGGVAVWALLASTRGDRDHRFGAIVLGVAVGSMAAYLLVSGLSLFPVTGEFLLPLSRAVSERIHFMRLLGSTPPY